MSIQFEASSRTFTLHTAATTYQMQVDGLGHLRHLYYGRRIPGDVMDGLYSPCDHGFSADYYQNRFDRGTSPDIVPQEYTGCNVGDLRVSCLSVQDAAGAYGADLVYAGHSIRPDKYALEGLPASYAQEGGAETLMITLVDPVTGLQAELLYGVFEKWDVITRAVRFVNTGKEALRLYRVGSFCLDLPFGQWELLHFHGRHMHEREPERRALPHGITTIASRRGSSSHHHNPFVVLCAPGATEDAGDCYGAMLVYSGNYRADVELDFVNATRLVMGLHDENFCWHLAPGEAFTAPEALLTFTHCGLTALSQRYQGFARDHICRGRWNHARRPVLINNWEATYFDFDSDKIFAIAQKAAALGVELMVLDDGWFGARNDDNRALGDWTVNEQKLSGGLNPLIQRIHGLGMKFGIWVEPEMISEDSELYRAHPDWALRLPGRMPAMGRNQLILDLSRPEVVDGIARQLTDLLQNHDISYVKWDMNRCMTDVFSATVAPERQGEVAHRYMLGLYSLLERLTTAFPDVLFEGCSGGGGRFDAGMLYYFPQIWCSDNTDAIERLDIQYGTSFGYPVPAVGSHVSACPNHQTGRSVSLHTRGVVAMAGTFGYELDLNKLSGEETAEVARQIEFFKAHYELIQNGLYYRLTAPGGEAMAWMSVARDASRALVSVVAVKPRYNMAPVHLRLKGLDPDKRYIAPGWRQPLSGAALMYAGLGLPDMYGDYPARQIVLTECLPC